MLTIVIVRVLAAVVAAYFGPLEKGNHVYSMFLFWEIGSRQL